MRWDRGRRLVRSLKILTFRTRVRSKLAPEKSEDRRTGCFYFIFWASSGEDELWFGWKLEARELCSGLQHRQSAFSDTALQLLGLSNILGIHSSDCGQCDWLLQLNPRPGDHFTGTTGHGRPSGQPVGPAQVSLLRSHHLSLHASHPSYAS